MGLYRAVVRPLAFALPPEAAHRAVMGLLSLPLPWPLLGGARDDGSLATELCGIRLANPIGLAAGFDKGCGHLDALGRLGFGYVVGGTITRRPRAGNPKPRIARSPARGAIVNAMGLPNPGAAAAAARLARSGAPCPRIASVADEAVGDVVAVHRLLEPFVDGIELNASCPNVSWGRDRDTEEHLGSLLRELVARKTKPLFVKLPPFRTSEEREAVLALARVARDRGADALTCSNTRPVADRRLAAGRGGLSGRPLAADTVRIVEEVRRATDDALPVNACGGVATGEDALACLEAGASTVQIYTALIYRGPHLLRDLTDAIARAAGGRRATRAAQAGVPRRSSLARVALRGRRAACKIARFTGRGDLGAAFDRGWDGNRRSLTTRGRFAPRGDEALR
jgi:dihydroorotate dehydrogenase